MATPYPGMDPEYLKSLQAMIAAMGPSAADKDAAKYQGLLAMGLGLMGARKGQEFAAAGNAGLLGLDARNRALAQATAEKGAGLNQAMNAQQLQGAMQAQADDAGYRKAMQDRYAPAATQPAPFGAQGGAPASFGPAIAPAQGAATDGARLSTSKLSDYEKAIQDAQYLEAKGVAPKYVEAAYAKAEKLRPKVKETRAVVDPQTGQRVLANIYEDGRIEIQKGAAPDMEKAHFLDVGNKIGAVDPFTGKPIAGGGMYNKALTPGEQASNQLGWANYKLAADRANQDKGEQFGTPISITNDSGTSLFAPRKGTNQLVPMVDSEGRPVSKAANIPQEYKNKAYIISNLEDDLKSYNDELSKITPADLAKPNTAARIKAKYGAVQMGLKGLFELGVIAGPDMEIMAQNLTDPTSAKGMMQLYAGGLKEQNKVLSEKLANNKRNLTKAFGQGGKRDEANDPLGLR